jgi:CheY-like chemotaxis protein
MNESESGQQREVLVVDDDPIIRDMMVDILSFEGLSIHVARNGREALTRLEGEGRYLVFLDLMMPGMDGSEVYQQINTIPSLRERHIIVIMSAVDKIEQGALLSVDKIMPKPFSVDDVIHVIQQYMR